MEDVQAAPVAAAETRQEVSFTEAVVALNDWAVENGIDIGDPSLGDSGWDDNVWWLHSDEGKLIATVARGEDGRLIVNP